MTTADLPIAVDRQVIARFCRARGIRSLSLFGSVLRSDFDPERSDVDVLAEFEPGALRVLFCNATDGRRSASHHLYRV